MVTGRASGNPGHAKNSWLTGTASWTFLSISQSILGVYPEYDGLRVAPCIPDDWDDFTVIRRFRGTEYHPRSPYRRFLPDRRRCTHRRQSHPPDRQGQRIRGGDTANPFPREFIWGAASSAYQTEGYATAGGGGKSIWDTFSHTPGRTLYEDTGDIACDAYHRYAEDIALLKEMGAKAYRFSTSWARIEPNADGVWNEAGLAYYDRVVDTCLASGITPYMTLYHWELPQAYEDKGGWRARATAEAFGRYAGMMAAHFRGRVRRPASMPRACRSIRQDSSVFW